MFVGCSNKYLEQSLHPCFISDSATHQKNSIKDLKAQGIILNLLRAMASLNINNGARSYGSFNDSGEGESLMKHNVDFSTNSVDIIQVGALCFGLYVLFHYKWLYKKHKWKCICCTYNVFFYCTLGETVC